MAAAQGWWTAALAQWPGNAAVCCAVANARVQAGFVDDAIAAYRKALILSPGLSSANNNLGVALRWKGQLAESLRCFESALADTVQSAKRANLLVNIGNVLQELGHLKAAQQSLRAALSLEPDHPLAHSDLLFCLLHSDDLEPGQLFSYHSEFGERFASTNSGLTPPRFSTGPCPLPRVAFVSADLRQHAVAMLLEPMWQAFVANRADPVHVYHTHQIEDQVSDRFKRHCVWRNVSKLSDAQLAQQIKDDRIDILIDLSGHTAANRLQVFAQKPAPVQMSWLGYPYTTGLRTIDYYIADRFLVPPASEARFVEKIIRLPAAAAFKAPDGGPAVNSLPALDAGRFTFGSFSRGAKITDSTLRQWARALQVTAGSRLVVGGLTSQESLNRVSEALTTQGIESHRIQFLARLPLHSYLKTHHMIDLLLDSVPYGAGSTSLFAAWMGVPTLTNAGTDAHSRQTAAIMLHLGLGDFVLDAPADQDDRLQAITSAPQRLNQIRQSLRDTVNGSVVCNPPRLAEALESALVLAWQRQTCGLPAASFDVGEAAA